MDLSKRPLILIRADTKKSRTDGFSNYQDVLDQKLFFTKPNVFHSHEIVNGTNSGMADRVDGDYLSNPDFIIDNSTLTITAKKYELDEIKSNFSVYNLSFIGVSSEDVIDEFKPDRISENSFTQKFIRDIQSANIVNNRGLSYVTGEEFEQLVTALNANLQEDKKFFGGKWVTYSPQIRNDKMGQMTTKKFLDSGNFVNLPNKADMHEFRLALTMPYCSSSGQKIDFKRYSNVKFRQLQNFFTDF